MLRHAGATVWRVGFNMGDRFFWPDRRSYLPFKEPVEAWPERFVQILSDKGVTDLVLYGDTRPVHRLAVREAERLGLRIHVFEEGYLRPYWVTYERGGSNGHSRLMEMSLADMSKGLAQSDLETPLPPAHWGDMREHVFYGALYHGFVMWANWGYRSFRPHRDLPVSREFFLYLLRLVLMPLHALDRILATWRIRSGGFPYHLVLLQLEHDSAFQAHSPFSSVTEFLTEVIAGFAAGDPRHHHLVIKAHQLEDGRAPISREMRRLAQLHG